MIFWKEKLKIKDLEIPRFIGGPVDGLTDSPYRKVIREFSKEELLYTEIRHVRSISNKKGGELALNFDQIERPLNFQITANQTGFVEEACKKILKKGVDAIDLNIACPARNVIKSGSGAALMANIKLLENVLKIIRENVSIPFTVKMRSGFKEKNALEVAKLVEDCGVDALAIHPRLQTAKFSGELDYNIVVEMKKQIKIPILWSGGITDWKSAKETYEKTGVDGFLVSRALWGQPWILKELHENSLGNDFQIDAEVRLKGALMQLGNMLEYYGPKGLYYFRKNIPYYVKDKESASKIRNKLVTSESVDEVKKGLIDFFREVDA